MRPSEIYLKHCRDYASANFKKNKLPHEDYKFTLSDVQNGLLRVDTAREMKTLNKEQFAKGGNKLGKSLTKNEKAAGGRNYTIKENPAGENSREVTVEQRADTSDQGGDAEEPG